MLLRALGFGYTTPTPTPLYCDNRDAITMSLHPANKPATRHVDMRRHFCRHHTELEDVGPVFVGTPDMVADFMTKQTLRAIHERHCKRSFGNQHASLPLPPILHLVA